MQRVLLTLLLAVAIAGLAAPARAQYMYLDSNGNGVPDNGDRLNANGLPTTVDVWIITDRDRDGTVAQCKTADGDLTINSYAVNLLAQNGTVTYSNFINQQPQWSVSFGEVNTGDGQYKNGRGSQTTLPPGGPYRLMTLTITGTSGTPSILINDLNSNSADYTSFGTRCSGTHFDNTYKLAGPAGGTDWTDADGLGTDGGNAPPVLALIGNKTVDEQTLLTFTAVAHSAFGFPFTYTLDPNAPAGATINPTTGVFQWTPSEAQGPGLYAITIRATENGGLNASDSETILVTVNEVNQPPVLNPIGNRTANEGSPFSIQATTVDDNAVTYSLGPGAPSGAAITAAGGNFTWTPTEAQGPGVYPVTIVVTESGGGNLSDSESIQITVREVNTAPVLGSIGNRNGFVGGPPVTFTATATDGDLPAQGLTFHLGLDPPEGATIHPSTGVFSWSPTTPGTFTVTVVVLDDGEPPLVDSETIQITVTVIDSDAPFLLPIPDKTVNESTLLSFVATASDPNGLPLTFALGPGSPPGAAIFTNGTFQWTPTEAQGPGVYPIEVVVSNGTLFDSQIVPCTVLEVNNFAPNLAFIPFKSVPEGSLLTFAASATDADIPTLLMFSLGPGAPAGAAITADGTFTWTPTEAQSGGHSIQVVVADNGSPPRTDSQNVSVAVQEVNTPPIINPIPSQTVAEGFQLTVFATATDPDIPVQTLSWSLVNGPPGALVLPVPGTFIFIPTEAQGPGSYSATIACSDGTATQGTATFAISVIETNVAPVLAQPANMSVNEGATGTQQLTATDADLPANTLSFSKVSGPFFLTVSASGLVTATPGFADQGTYPVTVRVSDGLLNHTRSFQVVVTDANGTPVADANGPYSGIVGVSITFDGSGSSDPNGDPLTYTWDFGDGASAGGVHPTHAYAVAGTYTVTLTVSDGSSSDSDVTTAQVIPIFTTSVFTTNAYKTLRLNSGKSQHCFQAEPVGGTFHLSDVDPASIRLVYGAGEIAAIAGKASVGDDKNQNGVLEMTACFTKENLRTLFAGVSTGDYLVTLKGELVTGGRFEGSMTIHVVGGGGSLASATISPNPLNPKATLTFATSKPGAVRVELFDVQGRLVRTLMDESSAASGYHDVTIDGHDGNGSKLASGIYYVKVRTSSDGDITKAVTVLK